MKGRFKDVVFPQPGQAHGSGSRSVSGTILISVNLSEVPDVYGPTPVNTSVTFPAASIATAVSQASGLTLSSIQLLELPAANEGTIYVGSSQRADTDTLYGYTSGNVRISQLRFVPASGFTGSVEIPYVACNASGDPIASGKLCLGVVRQMEDFSDITSSTWCYKYVLELSDAGVIDGYDDGTFKPNSQVTYGAALKLIMLAAGYAEQAPTGSNVFSGYLARAQEDGLVSGSVNLSAPITRLAVSQIAAKALGLNITNLSSVRPFTDTTDPYVQALNAAGIVEGYFSNGTSTFKPYNTLTRGQISAIPRHSARASAFARTPGGAARHRSRAAYTSPGMVNSTIPRDPAATVYSSNTSTRSPSSSQQKLCSGSMAVNSSGK